MKKAKPKYRLPTKAEKKAFWKAFYADLKKNPPTRLERLPNGKLKLEVPYP